MNEFSEMNERIKMYLIAVVIGLGSMMIYLSGYHLWLDHKFIDFLRDQITQQQQNQNKK